MFRTKFSCLLGGTLVLAQVSCSSSSDSGNGAVQHDTAATLFLEALNVRSTDPEQAIQLLTQSLTSRPSYNAYYHRAWLRAIKGQEEQARQDVAAGQQLEPESSELKWLAGELAKPARQRKLDLPPATVK